MTGRPGVARREWGGALVLFALALGLRLAHLAQLHAHDPFFDAPAVDGGMYHAWAQRIAAGDLLGQGVFQNGPAYPYFLAAIYALFGPSLLAAKAVQHVLGALACVGVWWLARRLFDARVALLAGLLVATYEMLLFFEGTLVVANLQVFLGVATLVLVVRAVEQPGALRWLASGIVVGLSALARPTALLFAGLIALALGLGVLRAGSHGAPPGPRRLALVLAFCAGIAAMVLPVTLRNAWVGGDAVLITAAGGLNFYTGNHPGANGSFRIPPPFPRSLADDAEQQRAVFRERAEAETGRALRPSEVSDFWLTRSLTWIREDPAAFGRLLRRKLALSANAYEPWNIRSVTLTREFSGVLRLPLPGFGLLAPLAFAGVLLAARGGRRLLPLYAMLAATWGSMLVFFVLARYRLPAVPVLAIFAAFTCVSLFDALRARQTLRVAATLAAVCVAALVVHGPAPREDLSVAYYNLGNRYRQRQAFEQAIASYRESIRRNPGYLSAHNNLALAYEQSGEHPEEAIRAWAGVRELALRRGLEAYVERADRHLRALRPQP